MRINEELRNNRRFRENDSIVVQGRNETAWVDGEVFRSTRYGKVHYYGFEFQSELTESDLRAVGPWTGMGGVEGNLGWIGVGTHSSDLSEACELFEAYERLVGIKGE